MLVFEAADLDSTVEALMARGVAFRRRAAGPAGLGHSHRRTSRDPEGNLIELNSPLLRVAVVGRVGGRGRSTTRPPAGPRIPGSTIGDTGLQQ